ncbi:unnamed protein product [Rhizophagus irregularis]|nr:unnamed protein product [Rhizophagus irregularis]
MRYSDASELCSRSEFVIQSISTSLLFPLTQDLDLYSPTDSKTLSLSTVGPPKTNFSKWTKRTLQSICTNSMMGVSAERLAAQPRPLTWVIVYYYTGVDERQDGHIGPFAYINMDRVFYL